MNKAGSAYAASQARHTRQDPKPLRRYSAPRATKPKARALRASWLVRKDTHKENCGGKTPCRDKTPNAQTLPALTPYAS